MQQFTHERMNLVGWGAKPERVAKRRTLRWLADVADPVKSLLPLSPSTAAKA
jgi:hypothetical protein